MQWKLWLLISVGFFIQWNIFCYNTSILIYYPNISINIYIYIYNVLYVGFFQLAEEAGIPAGVINIVTSSRKNTPAVGKVLCEHEKVAKVSFTGSTATGKVCFIHIKVRELMMMQIKACNSRLPLNIIYGFLYCSFHGNWSLNSWIISTI